jgi:hypothetical protein
MRTRINLHLKVKFKKMPSLVRYLLRMAINKRTRIKSININHPQLLKHKKQNGQLSHIMAQTPGQVLNYSETLI